MSFEKLTNRALTEAEVAGREAYNEMAGLVAVTSRSYLELDDLISGKRERGKNIHIIPFLV